MFVTLTVVRERGLMDWRPVDPPQVRAIAVRTITSFRTSPDYSYERSGPTEVKTENGEVSITVSQSFDEVMSLVTRAIKEHPMPIWETQ